MPRSQLYSQYEEYCNTHEVGPVNSASFGKLIRSVFQDIKTRRLGTRGQSKYHYCGIREKGLVYSDDEEQSGEHTNVIPPQQRTFDSSSEASHDDNHNNNDILMYAKNGMAVKAEIDADSEIEDEYHAREFYGGDSFGSTAAVLPPFPQLGTPPHNQPAELVQTFVNMYHIHCQCMLDHIQRLKLQEVMHVTTNQVH